MSTVVVGVLTARPLDLQYLLAPSCHYSLKRKDPTMLVLVHFV